MPLNEGSCLGPYRIIGALGAGGMGEVYRARDERLERDVAIKVLHDEGIADADLQRRFALEARAASALNHPNILTVHDVGTHDRTPYIVSELIDGEPLRAIIARGPLPLRKVLDIGTQVAAGLAAAHNAGIVHRDLKPANLMLTRDGFAKILDFGLAKKFQKQAAAAGQDQTITGTGQIVGTATYMSPEQVQGAPLDHRTDQFSFGLVLYEMVTGKPPFSRPTAVGTMMAICEEPVRPLAETHPDVPPPLRWCIERCIAKDREDRYTSTSDLHRELQTLRTRLEEVSSSRASGISPLPPPPARRRRRWLPPALAFAGLATGIILAETFLLPQTAVDMNSFRLRPLISSGANEGSPAWSVDGRSLAYTASVKGVRQLFVRDLNSPMSAQITTSAIDCDAPFWSSDDARIFYLSRGPSSTDLRSVGATGGSEQLIEKNVSGAAISPDGKTLAFLRTDPAGKQPLSLWLSSLGGGVPRQYTAGPFANGRYQFGYLSFSRDGKTLAAWLSQWNGVSEFWVLPYPDGTPREPFSLRQGAYPFSWLPDNRNIVFGGIVPGSMGADLEMVDTRRGSMRPISVFTRDALTAAASPDGKRIVFNGSENDFDLLDVPLDGSPVQPLLSTLRNDFDPAWSPTGDQLAYSTDRTGTSQLWVRSPREGWERPLVTEKDFGQTWISSFEEPTFSPDGRRIVYSLTGGAGHSIYVSSAVGGKPVRLSSDDSDERSPTWSGDGAWIAYLRNINGRWALVKANSGGGMQPVVLRDGFLPSHPKWNWQDSHWIVCHTEDGLTLVSDDGKESRVLSKDRWLVYGWSADGKAIYGIKQLSDKRRVVASIDLDGVEHTIGELQLPPDAHVRGFSLALGGKSFATSVSRPSGALWMLEGFQRPGWLANFAMFRGRE